MMKPRWSTLLVLLSLSVVFRLVPFALSRFGMSIHPDTTVYPWNFSPILPICLFGGAVYANRSLVYVIPWAAYFLGDLGIWMLTGHREWAFYGHQPIVYLSLALVATTGFVVRRRPCWWRIAGAGLLSSTAFFVVTNFGVWAFGNGIYPHTAAGLAECYVRALPFFRNTVISMAIFLPLLFSRMSLTQAAPTGRLAAQHG